MVKEKKEPSEYLTDEELEKLIDKIVKFGELIAERTLYVDYQVPLARRIVRALIRNEGVKITALFSRQSGKTDTVAIATSACALLLPILAKKMPALKLFEKGLWVGIFAPVGEQASTMFDRIYDVICSDTGVEVLISELGYKIPAKGGAKGNLIKLDNGSLVRMHSANRRAKVESKTYHLILLDESQEIESFMAKKSISPMGAAVNATSVFTGTPSPFIGFFYEQIEANKAHDARVRDSKKHLHFEADYLVAQKSNAFYRKYIKNEKDSLGEESDEFRMAYKLIWPITKGMVFTKEILQNHCYNKAYALRSTFMDHPCVAGLDIGKAIDSTVLTILYPDLSKVDEEGNMLKILLDWLEIEGDEWEKQYADIVEKLSNYNVELLVVDSTGIGDPIRDRLSFMLPHIHVEPFIFSPTSKDTGYKYLIKEVNAGRIIVPYDSAAKKTARFKKFEHQMTTLKKYYSGKFLNPRPVDADKGHDDYPDSLMLATYGTYYDIMPEIDIIENNFFASDRRHVDVFNDIYGRPRTIRR